MLSSQPDFEIVRYSPKDVGSLARSVDGIQYARLATFDLDGTTVIDSVPFPETGLRILRTKLVTSIASGAGPSSIASKISDATGTNFERANQFFSGPTIANESAHIFSSDTILKYPLLNDVLMESALNSDELTAMAEIIRTLPYELYDFSGFYPSVKSMSALGIFNPFQYLLHIPKNANKEKTDARLRRRYPQATVIDDQDNYAEAFPKLGASKAIFKPASFDAAQEIEQKIQEAGISYVSNEGYINVVSNGVNKGTAIDHLGRLTPELQELTYDQALHFGNDLNDLEALARVKFGFIIDSNADMTKKLLQDLSNRKRMGYCVIVNPQDLNQLCIEIAAT